MAEESPSDVTQVRATSAGCGLGWTDEESLALTRAAVAVSTMPTVGANVSSAVYARRILGSFARLAPSGSRTKPLSKDELDYRRWGGNGANSCIRQWTKIKKEYTAYHAAVGRVESLELTGNPTSDEISRVVLAFFNQGSGILSHAYDIVRNPSYLIGKPFPFHSCYTYLLLDSFLLLECAGDSTASGGVPSTSSTVCAREQGENLADNEILDDLNDGQNVGDEIENSVRSSLTGPDSSLLNAARRRGRPLGSKYSSTQKRLRRLGANDIDESASSITESQAAFARSYSEAQVVKAKIAERRLLVDEAKIDLEKYQLLLGPSSEATSSENVTVRRALIASSSKRNQEKEMENRALENQGVLEDDREDESDIDISDLNETENV
jgi:hypothetical protein